MKREVSSELSIDVRPPVSVYATYRRLSYQPWYAIAEFVDNSTQNYFDHKPELVAHPVKGKPNLIINIEYDQEKNRLIIEDNANGMDFAELTRAVKLNCPPANPSGRCEFGMGLKTAACWFARKWRIETNRLGLEERYSVVVDVDELSHQNDEKILVEPTKTKAGEHYTIISLEDLYKPLSGRTVGRIKEQLQSMYRHDLNSREIMIKWNGTPLSFPEAPILEEKLPNGAKTTWKKDVVFNVAWKAENRVLPVKGWVGIRSPGRQRDAGFVLFRRGRVITGGPDRGYRPEEVFGQGNTFRSQRLIGEFNMDEWPVTQAKDAFDWSGELEESFIDQLKKQTKDYADKAEGHRERPKPPTQEEMQTASLATREVIESPAFSANISSEVSMPTPAPTTKQLAEDMKKIKAVSDGPISFKLKVGKEEWVFKLFWQGQLTDAHWMSVEYPADTEIHIYLNSNHPFFEPYMGDLRMIELLQRFVLALALAEKMARQATSDERIHADDFRNNMNRVLRYASRIEETKK
jgi:hypothetical protein